MSWLPIATYGMTEAEVRAALMVVTEDSMQALRVELRQEGLPLAVIERIVQHAEAATVQHIDDRLPVMMKNLAITAGTQCLQ